MINNEPLINLMNHYADKGDFINGRKIARKLIEKDKRKLIELGKIEINSDNYRSVMDEFNRIEWLYKR